MPSEAVGATKPPDAYRDNQTGSQALSEPRQTIRIGRGPRRRWSRAVDRAVWTATGAATGFGLAIIAIAIYVRDLWVA